MVKGQRETDQAAGRGVGERILDQDREELADAFLVTDTVRHGVVGQRDFPAQTAGGRHGLKLFPDLQKQRVRFDLRGTDRPAVIICARELQHVCDEPGHSVSFGIDHVEKMRIVLHRAVSDGGDIAQDHGERRAQLM